jgi:hypothetical protein
MTQYTNQKCRLSSTVIVVTLYPHCMVQLSICQAALVWIVYLGGIAYYECSLLAARPHSISQTIPHMCTMISISRQQPLSAYSTAGSQSHG